MKKITKVVPVLFEEFSSGPRNTILLHSSPKFMSGRGGAYVHNFLKN